MAAPPMRPGPEPGRPIPVPLMPAPSFAARGVATEGLALVTALDGAEFGETRLAGPLFVGWMFIAARGGPPETIKPDVLSARWAKLTFAASKKSTNAAHGVRQGFQCKKSKKTNMSVRIFRFDYRPTARAPRHVEARSCSASRPGLRSVTLPKNIICSAGTTTSNMIGPMSMPPTTTVASGRCT